MTAAAITNAVRDRFVEQVATPQELAMVHENGPDPEILLPQWCRLSVQLDMPAQVSTAPARYRVRGRLIALLHAAGLTTGDATTLALFSVIETAFTGVLLSSPMVRFYRPGLIGDGDKYGGWYRRMARIDFYADEIGTG